MEQHLQTLKESHGFPEYLEYRNSCISKHYITKGVPTLHHQLFFPVEKLEDFKDRWIGFTYNDRVFSDVKLEEVEGKVIKSSKGYTFTKSKMSEPHICVREFTDKCKFETRNFIDSPKV